MMKKVFLGCLIITFCLYLENVNAASLCEYSEQVELSNVASTIQTGYDIQRVIIDMEGNVVTGVSEDEVTDDSMYMFSTRSNVYVNNLTEKVYIHITSDKGLDRTYHYSDTMNGNISFDGGNFDEIVNYKVEVLSDNINCSNDLIRTIDFVTPMENQFFYLNMCSQIPDFEYCKQYVTAPFMSSDNEIRKNIEAAYLKYVNGLKEEEEEKSKGFFEKIGDFIEKNKTIVYSIVGVIVVGGALATVVIIKKRRSRLL